MDAIGSNIRVDTYGWEVKRILPIINEDINEEWISDKSRYACDGLKNQRLDTPYIKNNNKLQKISWDDAMKIIVDKIKQSSPDKIAGFTGDLTNNETLFIAKEFQSYVELYFAKMYSKTKDYQHLKDLSRAGLSIGFLIREAIHDFVIKTKK